MFENKTFKILAIITAVVTFLIFIYILSLGEGIIFSLAIPLLIGGLVIFKLYDYFKKKNPFVHVEGLAFLYAELNQYDPDLLKVFNKFSKTERKMTLNDLLAIRNVYAASINHHQLQSLINEGTEESQYEVEKYNYSLYLLDDLIENTRIV